jgi:hypothetical protein
MNEQPPLAKTIWSTPPVRNEVEAPPTRPTARQLQQLREDGFTVLKGVFLASEIAAARQQILDNLCLFKNTRPTRSSRHLAGFHRFPPLEPLHSSLSNHPAVLGFLRELFEGGTLQSIGLSDITVNRSQLWHRDLLRGRFSQYLDETALGWDEAGGGVHKVLLYLQEGSSLKIVRGSHLEPGSLEDDRHSEPHDPGRVATVAVETGDIVIMDIRCSHRGADESAYIDGQCDDEPRMLVSTALGDQKHPLTRAMEIGNFYRLLDWLERNP